MDEQKPDYLICQFKPDNPASGEPGIPEPRWDCFAAKKAGWKVFPHATIWGACGEEIR